VPDDEPIDEELTVEKVLAKIDRALWGEPGLFDGLVVVVGRLRDDVAGVRDKLRDMDDAREIAREAANRRTNILIAVVPLVTAVVVSLLTAWLT
jgi:hypothetical protein